MKNVTRFIIALLLPVICFAQGTSVGGGTLKLPSHAIVGSMADASMIMPGSLASSQFNPANIFMGDSKISVLFSHTTWFQDISAQHLSVGLPMPLGRLMLGLGNTTISDIPVREGPGPAAATFSAQTAQMRAGWALEISSGIVGGIAASYVYEKLYADETSGIGVDVGLLYQTPVDGLLVGASYVNAGSLSPYRTENVDLPGAFRFGGRYKIDFEELVVEPAAAFRIPSSGSSVMAVGASATYAGVIAVRSGWQSGNSARSISFGLGAAYGGAALEYATVPFSSDLGTSHMISISIEF